MIGKQDFAPLFKDAIVYVLADNDEPGRRVADKICADLQEIAKSVKVILPVPDIAKGDITDYFEAGHSKEEFERLLPCEIPVTDTRMTAENQVNDVRQMLMYKVEYDKDGNEKSRKLIQNVKNFEIVLENDGRFRDKIKFDEFFTANIFNG